MIFISFDNQVIFPVFLYNNATTHSAIGTCCFETSFTFYSHNTNFYNCLSPRLIFALCKILGRIKLLALPYRIHLRPTPPFPLANSVTFREWFYTPEDSQYPFYFLDGANAPP